MKKIIPLLFLSCLPLLASEQGSGSTSDLILAELQKMGATIERLEKRIDTMEAHISSITEGTTGSNSSGARGGTSEATLMERVVEAVHVREQRINYPWMQTDLWDNLKKGMSPEEVETLLGEPTMEDPSLHKKIDTVYTYRGRRPADGELLLGKVKFRKNKVVVIEAP